MRTQRMLINAAAAVALLLPGGAWPQAQDVSQVPIPELRPFRPEQPRLVTLPNRMVLMLAPDRELPLVRGYALIRGGSRDEPADKVGLVSIYGQAWRTGGTKIKGHSGDELDVLLENKAALVETGDGLEATYVSWDCMKGDFDTVMGVVAELLRTEPAFPQDKIDLAKTQLNSAIARRNDDADGILRRESRKLVYGASSPYARTAEYATVAAVTRDDLVAWHRRYVHPNNVVMAVWGDFDAAEMERRLRRTFSDWPRGTPAREARIAVPGPRPGCYLIEKNDLTQSKIQMAGLGLRRDTPDFYAVEVMNEILGGGFGSRLMTNVRAKQGLAYQVWGRLGLAYDHPGMLTVGMGTKSDATMHGIQALLAEIDGMIQRPITREELARAKDGLLNSFIFRIDSKDKVLHEKVSDYFHGYPLDRLERYMEGVRAVTVPDVERAARRYLHKGKLAILVVGKPSDFDRPLSSLGPVTKIDITIPTPGSAKAEPSAAVSDDAGRALLRRAVAGLGDPQKLKTLASMRCRGQAVMQTPQGEMLASVETTLLLPDRLYQRVTTAMGEMKIVITPQTGFMVLADGSRDLPIAVRDDQVGGARLQPFVVGQRGEDPQLVVRADGAERVGDVEATVAEVAREGARARWAIDPSTGRVLRVRRTRIGLSGPAEETQDFSDFRPVDGLMLPFRIKVSSGGAEEQVATLEACEVNPPVDTGLFEKWKSAQP